MNLSIKECTGYTKEEAFKDLGFSPTVFKGSNSTLAWRAAGKPIPGTSQFESWAKDQLNAKTKNCPGFGLYIITDEYTPDYRSNPCKVVNRKTKQKSSWKIQYWVRQDELDTHNIDDIQISKAGPIVSIYDSKAEAIKAAKELTVKTHKNYSLLRIKVPTENFISGFTLYTPSSTAKKGTFIAFGYEKSDD